MLSAAQIRETQKAGRKAAFRRVSMRRNLPIGPADPSDKNTWTTPLFLFLMLHAIFRFTLDPCCLAISALCDSYFTEKNCGLGNFWFGRVFMNPPYGRKFLSLWLNKALNECLHRQVVVVALIPLSPETAAWRASCAPPNVDLINLPARTKFGGVTSSPSFHSVLLIFWPPGSKRASKHSTPIQRENHRTYLRYQKWTASWTTQTLFNMSTDDYENGKARFSEASER